MNNLSFIIVLLVVVVVAVCANSPSFNELSVAPRLLEWSCRPS